MNYSPAHAALGGSSYHVVKYEFYMLPSMPEIEPVKGHFVSEAGRHTTHNLSWLWRLVAWWQVVLIH